MTLHPDSASLVAIACPRPAVEPVIKAVHPLSGFAPVEGSASVVSFVKLTSCSAAL
jgi:hypothetical protein